VSDKKPDVNFRKAKITDIPTVVQLLADDQLGNVREQTGSPLPLFYRDAFEKMARQEGNDLIVTEIDGEIVGCMQLTIIYGISRKGMSRCQIEGVRIASQMRGSGLGKKMMIYAIDYAKSAGCGLIQLTTDMQRIEAQQFYEKLGFVGSHLGMKMSIL
jgi:ribosomal protein S18 acetylase RimI-like enzyme